MARIKKGDKEYQSVLGIRTDYEADEYIKELKEKKEKEPEKKLVIACGHLVFAKTPIDVVLLRVTHHHPKHDGRIFACTLMGCAYLFDNFNLGKDASRFYPIEEKAILKNIKSTIER